MDIDSVVDDFYSETGVKLTVTDDDRHEDWEVLHAFNPLEDKIIFSAGVDTIREYHATGFRIDLGQGCAISGALPGMTVAEHNETTEVTEWFDEKVMAAIEAKCGVFNRELMN